MSITESKLKVEIVPETPGFGAVVVGVDAREPLGDELVATLKEAVLHYKVLFFRAQHLSRSEHVALAAQFGETFFNKSKYPNAYDEEGLANVSVVPNFHADVMYRPESPSFSFLQMLELPEVGGDTVWVDLVASYLDLSQQFREFLETLTVMQGVRDYDLSDDELRLEFKQRKGKDLTLDEIRELREELAPWEAPLVRVIPENGVKNYWIAPAVTRMIKGLSKEESDAVLGVLFRHQMQPKYVYRWRWGAGDIAFWDQRTTLHCGMTDYGTVKRHGNRISIVPNRPIGIVSPPSS
jgi:taurine dioxygenase